MLHWQTIPLWGSVPRDRWIQPVIMPFHSAGALGIKDIHTGEVSCSEFSARVPIVRGWRAQSFWSCKSGLFLPAKQRKSRFFCEARQTLLKASIKTKDRLLGKWLAQLAYLKYNGSLSSESKCSSPRWIPVFDLVFSFRLHVSNSFQHFSLLRIAHWIDE